MSKINEYEKQDSLQQAAHNNDTPNITLPYFAIFAENEIGYAIPIENIEEFVLLPITRDEAFITIDGEKIPCISLRKDKNISLEKQAGYLICKGSSGARIALLIGGMYDCHRFFVKTLPVLSTDSLEDAQIEGICDRIKAYRAIKSTNYQIDVLLFQ